MNQPYPDFTQNAPQAIYKNVGSAREIPQNKKRGHKAPSNPFAKVRSISIPPTRNMSLFFCSSHIKLTRHNCTGFDLLGSHFLHHPIKARLRERLKTTFDR